MLPKRLEILPSVYYIENFDNMTPYIPKEDELYTYIGIRINTFWIGTKTEHFHTPDGVKLHEIIWFLAELENGKVLHMVTSSVNNVTVDWVLGQAGIKFTNVERQDSRQIDESDKTTNSDNFSDNSVSDSWIIRFWNWIRSILYW